MVKLYLDVVGLKKDYTNYYNITFNVNVDSSLRDKRNLEQKVYALINVII